MTVASWTSIDPMTGEVVWEGHDADVDAAVARARRVQADWALRPLAERVAIATHYADAVKANAETFATTIARETGKPIWEARTEIASVAAKVAISIAAQADRAGERHGEVAGAHQAVRHKPHGVLAVLGPYNFPAHLPNGHIVPALLAGNTVVFKPSELTPASGELMAALWREAGLPDDVLVLAQGRADTGRAIARHDGIDGLLFTGSSATGLALHEAFAHRPDRILAIEAGGNNPLIAWDVPASDIDNAASLIVQSAFISAGQRCTCARRLIVGPSNEALLAAVAGLAARVIAGGPFEEPAPYIGPVVDMVAAQRVEQAWQRLVAAGGQVILPLRRLRENTPLLSPAIIDVTGLSVPDEEIFGPVLQVIRVENFDAALAAANATRFGLAAALIGGDQPLYDRFWAASRAGVVNWNRPTTGASSAAPFGGVGTSGNHRPSAYYAADYCAWPVASLEAQQIDGGTIPGLRPAQ
ncbi:MAG: succinylglutamate-semialdehyde dehydrogenase [Candidatus Sphingomonas colombiensis]|nr:succinylglutamate-semialdehyde dehydrogenase [Sphingomonas sp.]WEK41999.1 MAG: succinylglutamate-semialdehyde dehydrogenase [Sphingomonas sp.]